MGINWFFTTQIWILVYNSVKLWLFNYPSLFFCTIYTVRVVKPGPVRYRSTVMQWDTHGSMTSLWPAWLFHHPHTGTSCLSSVHSEDKCSLTHALLSWADKVHARLMLFAEDLLYCLSSSLAAPSDWEHLSRSWSKNYTFRMLIRIMWYDIDVNWLHFCLLSRCMLCRMMCKLLSRQHPPVHIR